MSDKTFPIVRKRSSQLDLTAAFREGGRRGEEYRLMILDSLLDLLGRTEGRDKFTKLLQFTSLQISAIGGGLGNTTVMERMGWLSQELKEARQLLRLFKWCVEYKRIIAIIDKRPPDADDFDMLLLISIRLLLIFYWIFDNLDILTKLRIFKIDKSTFEKTGKKFWLVSLILHLWLNVRRFVKCNKQIHYPDKVLSHLDPDDEQVLRHQQINARKREAVLGIAKVVGDLFVCSREIGGLKENQIFRWLAGFGGTVSACISLYGMYSVQAVPEPQVEKVYQNPTMDRSA